MPGGTWLIGINETLFTQLLLSPVPEVAVVYRQRWTDREGDILLMDAHQSTLRHIIRSGIQLTKFDWMVIMYGIFTRLVHAFEHGFVHGDLKPSNSI